jgi:integrase/recombinase XerD
MLASPVTEEEVIMARPKSKVITVRVTGPLAAYVQQFRSLLAERGFTPLTRVSQLQVMVHLSKWLRAGELDVGDLTSARVDEYLAQRRRDGYSSFCTRASLTQLLELLARCGAPLVEPVLPESVTGVLLAGYGRFMREERGLAASTTAAYVLRARRFVAGYGHGADLGGARTGDVTRAVLREADTVSAGSAQFFVVALRSFLRYCYLTGLIGADLSAASLPVTGRRRSVLPRGISAADARALLRSCDRRTAVGRRDYAVILILLRLGLRAGELAALQLPDIDWRAGRITVHGKAGRVDLLPLPADVGAAIAAYLRHARPRTVRREVFLRVTAPRTGLERGSVSLIVRRACVRAGLTPCGSHRLRHSLACDMVRVGVPLHEIGQVLRHDDTTSTSIYARVDVDQLRIVARPWPVGTAR